MGRYGEIQGDACGEGALEQRDGEARPARLLGERRGRQLLRVANKDHAAAGEGEGDGGAGLRRLRRLVDHHEREGAAAY